MLNSAQSAFQAAIALWLSQGVPWTVCKFTSQANDLEISNGEDRFVHRLKSFCPKPLIQFGSLLGKKGEAEKRGIFLEGCAQLCTAPLPAPIVGKGITRRDLCVKEANILLCKNQADIK